MRCTYIDETGGSTENPCVPYGSGELSPVCRETVFWPGIISQMRELIQQCEVCCKFHPAQPQEPLKPHPIPSHPWESVAVDPFSLEGNNFMVTVDYHSGYWEIDQLMSTVSETVIRCLKRHFARYGIPSRVLTDNRPQFSAEGFKQFATNWGFEHVTSSPRFPQSNGKAESAVKTAVSHS